MKTQRIAMAMLGALLLGSGWLLVRQRERIASLEAGVFTAEAKLATAEAKTLDLQRALKGSEDRADKAARALEVATKQEIAASKVAAPQGSSGGRPGPDPIKPPKTSDPAAEWLASANDPAVVRRLDEQARLQTLRRYGALFDRLGLPADQREQLTKLLTDRRQVSLDVAAASFQRGSDPREDSVSYADMVAATRHDLDTQIHALLGDSGYQSYEDFDRTTGQSQVLDRFGQLLSQIQQPLSDEQSARLQASMEANATGRVSAKVVADAKEFLTPEQLQALRDLRAIQQANSRKRNQPLPILPVTAAGK